MLWISTLPVNIWLMIKMCIVSTAALDELADPDDEMDAETVFLEHQYKFEEIAEGLILNHKVVDGELHIDRGEL
mgnify:CR=1 FL=1